MPLELWGGVECTVNRTGDHYRDQTKLSGHEERLSDLDLFADLGVKALRYPILWERTMPDPAAAPDWRWPDARLHRMRALGIRPIAGLVHHGSGPRHTSLLDDGFATGLGHYAGLVAARYPWVAAWTPVNEPLTTARFAALYGHWYPHAQDARAFWCALLNQIDGTRAAMRAIRRINPAARLIQTEDIGHTSATAPLEQQAAFDNVRRWASWDLLFGRVTPDHPLHGALARMGLGDRLRRIAYDPCPPDVIGVNHYLTSDRFLDHRLDRYPARLHGGNGTVAYADTEAVRAVRAQPPGLAGALRDSWQRYGVPIAVTEVHNGSTRDEQLRWAAEGWDMAVALRAEGVDVRAVTAWSLLGSHGWNTLLTGEGKYEPGVFDLATGTPQPTALAELWRGLPHGALRHPVADEPGWWRRPERLLYARPDTVPTMAVEDGPMLAILGGGEVANAFARVCVLRGLRHVVLTDRAWDGELDGHPSDGGTIWGVIDLTGRTCCMASGDEDGMVRHAGSTLGDAQSMAVLRLSAHGGLLRCDTDFVNAQIDMLIDSDRTCAWRRGGGSINAADEPDGPRQSVVRR
ncbi:family 1 glycosylhydrolase [Sphingomonas montana]|uniref:family 1 glycosylhydrolase n=1 Tax=Sphingomonas montana TaxID=1843236 RepID=UPI00101AD141|nr:family 1 glycosylhydrolase [Sphingomonas montana]